MGNDIVKLCLPKGDAIEPLAQLLETIKFPILEYTSNNRTYRPKVQGLPVRAKIMTEKDVALQVAVGNYDIGFCGMDWVREHTTKYKASALYVFKPLGICKKNIYACSGLNSEIKSIRYLKQMDNFITLVSEYPNLAQSFAIYNRLRKFKIFSAWGSVQSYPHEHADVVLIAGENKVMLNSMGLHILRLEIESELCLVVNYKSFIEKNITSVLEFF